MFLIGRDVLLVWLCTHTHNTCPQTRRMHTILRFPLLTFLHTCLFLNRLLGFKPELRFFGQNRAPDAGGLAPCNRRWVPGGRLELQKVPCGSGTFHDPLVPQP